MSFLWVGGRRVYFGWNLKHEVLCGCLNTLWHVVWEEGWARGGAELCGCRKQSSSAAGNSFGGTPPGKYLTAEKPRPVLYTCTVKTVFGPSVGSILPFFMWAGRSGRSCLKLSTLQPTHSRGQLGLWLNALLLERSCLSLFPSSGGVIQLPAHHVFFLARNSRYWGSCVLLLPGPDPRKVAACIALRVRKPLCTAERLKKSLGTSASPPQLYSPYCSRWWKWN